jgi:hypothetical protein
VLDPQIYLIIREKDDWSIQVFRDVAHLRQDFPSPLALNAILHVGFNRPGVGELNQLATAGYADRGLIATAATRYSYLPTAHFSPLAQSSSVGPLFTVTRLWDQARPDPAYPAPTTTPAVVSEPPVDPSDQLAQVFAHLPDEVREKPVSALNVSVRALNALRSKGIHRVDDLRSWTMRALMKIPNLGFKTAAELVQELHKAVGSKAPSLYARVSRTAPLQVDPDQSESEVAAHTDETNPERERLETFRAVFDRWLNGLQPSHAGMMKRRMGLEGDPKTLEEVGLQYGVTRERIRQIETKALKRLNNMLRWHGATLGSAIEASLRDRAYPLYVNHLSDEVSVLAGCDFAPQTWKYLLAKLDSGLTLLALKSGGTAVCGLSQDAWDERVSAGIALLNERLSTRPTQSVVRALLEAVLGSEVRELAADYVLEVCANAKFSKSLDDAEPVLVGIGRSMDTLVMSILEASPRPLHFKELTNEVRKERPEADYRFVHGSASKTGLLLGRGTFGLRRHIPLDDSQLDWLRKYAVALVMEGPSDRQWHAHELAKLVKQDCPFADRVDHFVLNFVLSGSDKLQYLGRFVWQLKGGARLSTHDRIDFRNAVESVLARAKKPLTTPEIFETIQATRGLSKVAQIHPNESVVRLGPGLWGLRSRDLQLSRQSIKKILDKIHQQLEREDGSLSAEQLVGFLPSGVRHELRASWEILDAAASDDRFRVSRSDLALSTSEAPDEQVPDEDEGEELPG